jgi:hypothetical protein
MWQYINDGGTEGWGCGHMAFVLWESDDELWVNKNFRAQWPYIQGPQASDLFKRLIKAIYKAKKITRAEKDPI